MRVLICGGGSGGHIFPAIAVARALKRAQPDIDILFIGAKGKMEMEKVPKAGFPIRGLWISGFHRSRPWRNVLFPVKLVWSVVDSFRILNRYKPDAVAGFGGFASGPILYAAAKRGVPTLIQEQNALPGKTNLRLGKMVNRICVAYPSMGRFFPEEKIVQTGNPVRSEMFDVDGDQANAREHFGLEPNKKTLLVFGGSLGARTLNDMMLGGVDELKKRSDIQVLWQCGSYYFELCKQSECAGLPNVRLTKFIDRMDLAFQASEMAVCRAGASTIGELSAVGHAAILVPSPNVAEDHQTKNAKALAKQGAVVWMEDGLAVDMKWQQVFELLDDEDEMAELRRQIKALAKPRAADEIANEIIQLIG